ncbi:hypothetical protein CHS0354_016398 [Potamilus streckersoni]|uniref:Uncharacterized protein n=1 Tax=Potamilus streckersoni TaxID=2493646 RepID=A0AAE0SVU9_9BIVA|nr:hypothetical protein CHS0354_016398 [Potamilus streckersoni]
MLIEFIRVKDMVHMVMAVLGNPTYCVATVGEFRIGIVLADFAKEDMEDTDMEVLGYPTYCVATVGEFRIGIVLADFAKEVPVLEHMVDRSSALKGLIRTNFKSYVMIAGILETDIVLIICVIRQEKKIFKVVENDI